jgi:alpha-galactosidase
VLGQSDAAAGHGSCIAFGRCLSAILAFAFALAVLVPNVAHGQAVDHDAAAQSWTIRSGEVAYRLVNRDGLGVDYFGPASDMTARPAESGPMRSRDLTGLADGQSLAAEAWTIEHARTLGLGQGASELHFVLRHRKLPLTLEASYAGRGQTGVITRELRLTNNGQRPIAIEALPQLSLDLPAGDYTIRYLWGGAGQERQLAVERLGAGSRSFVQRQGRSSDLYVPWLSMRNETSGVEYVAELAWSGNWQMQVEHTPGTWKDELRARPASVTMAIRHDFGGSLRLGARQSFDFPRIALTASGASFDHATNQMHRYQREFVAPKAAANGPPLVQYNSWYALGPDINSKNTRDSADWAAKLGAEVYVLDSGWYASGDWSKQLGDYQVDAVKFPRGIEELAGHVRRRGMKFGLWVEIENAGILSSLFKTHRDWCLPYNGAPAVSWERCQLDFGKAEVRQWARRTIDRLMQRYDLDWIKIDYNIPVGERFDPAEPDRRGRRLYDHIQGYYSWLDELRAAYPDLIVENCSSGGLRFDTGIMAHTHTSWISDAVDPVSSLQLRYGCTVQFASEWCNHWIVGDTDKGEIKPDGPPGWWDFMFRVAMNGQFGISGRIWEWSDAVRARAAENILLYKQIRGTIAGADVYHLTPPPDRNRPKDWMALQYVAPDQRRSVLLAYRLPGGSQERAFPLQGLDGGSVYAIRRDGIPAGQATGAELATAGLKVRHPDEWRAAVIELTATSAKSNLSTRPAGR